MNTALTRIQACLVLVLFCSVMCGSTAAAITLLKAGPAPAALPRVCPPAPAPLPLTQLQAVVEPLRRMDASISTQSLTAGSTITLTPAAPLSGLHYLNVINGSTYPVVEMAALSSQMGTEVDIAYRGLTPGKTYLLDLSVAGETVWTLMGGIQSQTTAQNGHVLAAFVASSSSMSIGVKLTSANFGFLYKAVLTQLN